MSSWKAVKSDALSEQYFPRFIVIDAESGKVLDDAQGYGYKTAQKAIVAFKWKHDKKAQAWRKKKKKIKKWLEENPEFDNELEDMLFQTQKAVYQGFEDAKLEVDDIQWLLDKHGLTKFSADEIFRYLDLK